MKEKTLLKIALICTILGIVLLLFLSELVEVKESKISEAKQIDNGIVRITGIVENVRVGEKATILTISKKESIDVVVFENPNFQKGDFVDVTGEVQDYEGKKEILAKEIK